jgi:hypothetical protein
MGVRETVIEIIECLGTKLGTLLCVTEYFEIVQIK